MGDLISIKSGKPIQRVPNWRSFIKSENRREERFTMTQKTVRGIFEQVVTANNPDEAFKQLSASLPTGNHLTYWLGQIGHRLDVRLGRDRGFPEYLAEVASSLWKRSRNQYRESFLESKGGTMKSKKAQSQRVVKATTQKQKMPEIDENDSAVEQGLPATDVELTPAEAVSEEPKTSSAPQIGRIQQYWIFTMLVFADCAVQKDPDEVFDVLARNFDTPGALSWWLYRIGHGDMAKYVKGRDLVEYFRKVAHELHRDLKGMGKPVARL